MLGSPCLAISVTISSCLIPIGFVIAEAMSSHSLSLICTTSLRTVWISVGTVSCGMLSVTLKADTSWMSSNQWAMEVVPITNKRLVGSVGGFFRRTRRVCTTYTYIKKRGNWIGRMLKTGASIYPPVDPKSHTNQSFLTVLEYRGPMGEYSMILSKSSKMIMALLDR